MTDAVSWPPPIGETVGIERARAMLAAVDDELRRVGAAVVAAIQDKERGVTVNRRIVTAAEIGRYRRDDSTAGCVVAVVDYIGKSGSVTVVGICVRWDDARVYVPRMPGIEA